MKNYTHLELAERSLIQYLLKEGKSISFIAQELKRDRSTIYREVKKRNLRIKWIQCQRFWIHPSE